MAGKGGEECSVVQFEFHSISSQDEKEEEKEEPIFIEQPPDRFNCLICHCVMKEPHIVTCCCNKMCRDCIQRVHHSSQPCPTCREPNFNSFLEKQLNSEILDLKVRCTHHNNGCEWVGELRDLKKHTNPVNGSCGFVEVKCPFGCPVAYLRKDTIDHESTCSNLPPEKQVKRTMRITDQFKEELQAMLSHFQELYKSESARVNELTTQLEDTKEKMKSQFEAEKKQLLEESKQQIALLTQELKMKNEEHQQQMMQLQQESKKEQKEILEASNKQLAEFKEKMEKQHQRQLTDIKDQMSTELKELLEESKQQITLLTQELKMKNEEHQQQMMQLQQEFKKKEKERSEAVNKHLAELKEKEKQMEKQHQKELIDIKDKLSTELKELYHDEHKQRMEESREQSKNIHQKLKLHYDEEYQQQLKEAKRTLELEKRKQLEEVKIVLAAEKEQLITEYAEECKKATAVIQTYLPHHAQHNQAIHTHNTVNPVPEQVPPEGGSNEGAAATGGSSAGDGKTFTGLSKVILLLMPKIREDCCKNMQFFPEEGKAIIIASSEEEREQCVIQFQNTYQEIIKNRQLKSSSLEIPPAFQMENMFDLLEEFDAKY
ncbi:PREDICTED: TNF receptor-associated factor 5-like, partial [Amphimedon queenslandica]|uniref:RING-type domain-containing protein n=2 Tax=Amphimedon queenslandica TaxID=400682 RepID=A0AAN0JWT3_AMPQE